MIKALTVNIPAGNGFPRMFRIVTTLDDTSTGRIAFAMIQRGKSLDDISLIIHSSAGLQHVKVSDYSLLEMDIFAALEVGREHERELSQYINEKGRESGGLYNLFPGRRLAKKDTSEEEQWHFRYYSGNAREVVIVVCKEDEERERVRIPEDKFNLWEIVDDEDARN